MKLLNKTEQLVDEKSTGVFNEIDEKKKVKKPSSIKRLAYPRK